MEQPNIRQPNRQWIVVNYGSLVAVLALFYTGKLTGWSTPLLIAEIAVIGLFLFSFWRAFLRTRFWQMAHTSSQQLDERELQVVLRALQYSYSIFTITCLIVIYALALAGLPVIDVVLAAALLYLAHTLPAVVVGWKERYPVMAK